jgi:hypothetical protein
MTALRLLVGGAALPKLPPLLVRPGLWDEFLIEAFEGYGTDVIARTVAQARGNPAFARLARDHYRLGLLVDLDSWRNQLPVEERPKSFAKAGFAAKRALDLSREVLTPNEEDAYVRAALEESVACRATHFVAPYHLGGGPDCQIRRLDLRLIRKTAARFRALRLDEPRVGDGYGRPRKLYAAIAIRPGDLLDAAARATLVHLYAALPVDGFIVKFVGLAEESSIAHVEAAASFIFNLKLRSERTVVIGGGKNLALAFVGAGLDSAMLGIGEGEVFRASGRAFGGGVRPVYHRGALRSVDTHAKSVKAGYRAEILFFQSRCDCGHHRSDLPPSDERSRKLHTMSCRIRDFSEAAAWAERSAAPQIATRVRSANALATPIGYPALPESFVAVARIAEETRRRFRDAETG